MKQAVYEELAVKTLIQELSVRLRVAARASKPDTQENFIQLVREDELEREEI